MNRPSSQSSLNPTQIHLLQMFSFNKRKEDLLELKAFLLDFYRKKVDEESANLWDKLDLNDAKIEKMLHTHKRTPYK